MLIQELKTDFEFLDSRGKLVQLTRGGYGQVNYVFSRSGAVRGKHFHKYNDEVFYIIQGQLLLLAEKNGETERRKFFSGEMFLVPAMVKHSFEYEEDTELISLYTGCVELQDGTKDIHTEYEEK